MKYIIFTLVALLAFTSSVFAQQVDPPTMQLDSGPAGSDSAVIRTIEITSVNDTGNSNETGADGSDGEDGKGSEGGDAPVPTLFNEGTDLTDIGAPKVNTSADMFIKIDGVEGESDTAVSIDEREMKESGEKGGTEDINIGVGELSEDEAHKDWIIIESATGPTRMNKADLIDSIAKDTGEGTKAVYVKIEGIKGESDDTAEAKKPKEIVVVGNLVRQDGVPQLSGKSGTSTERTADSFFDIWLGDSESTADSFFDVFVDVTDEDVQLQAISVAQEDKKIKEVKLTEDEVRVDYFEKVKLFGLIPIQTTKTITVNTNDAEQIGRVKVKMPWWNIFATKAISSGDLEEQIETALQNDIPETTESDDRPTEEVAFYYNKIQAQTLQTISNVSK